MKKILLMLACVAATLSLGAKDIHVNLQPIANLGTISSEEVDGVTVYTVTQTGATVAVFTGGLPEDLGSDVTTFAIDYSTTQAGSGVQIWYSGAGTLNTWTSAFDWDTSVIPATGDGQWGTYTFDITSNVPLAGDRSVAPKTGWSGVAGSNFMLNWVFTPNTVVKFKDPRFTVLATGVKAVDSDAAVKVVPGAGTITVNAPAKVYSLTGAYMGATSGVINVPAGAYVVKAGSKAVKVLVK